MKVTRRTFLATAGAAGVAPLLLGATNKSGSRAPILGEGEHQYEALHDWGTLPANIRYGKHARRLRRLARPYLHSSHGSFHQRISGHDCCF